MAMIALIIAYTAACADRWHLSAQQWHRLLCLLVSAQAMAMIIFACILIRPQRSDLRRKLGMVSDYGLLGLAMTWLGAPMAGLYVVLLWVTIGNGLRFGRQWLQTAVAMAVLSFGSTLANSHYWQQQLELGLALLAALVAIPLSLSGRLQAAEAQTPPEESQATPSSSHLRV
ncbi:RpfH protein [Xanthomonas maliensis]|uniref:RpfH protein n=1 Tax=Xanthomonas maliensis TaxID=1321368 RepID=UPI001263F385